DNLQSVIQRVTRPAIIQVEIGMIGEIAQCWFIGRGAQFDRKRARIFKPVSATCFERTRKAHIPIGGMERQRHEIRAMQRNRPVALPKTLAASMQSMFVEKIWICLI